MAKRASLWLLLAAAACGTPVPPRLAAETSTGSAGGPIGKVLVVSANCGSMATLCPSSWAETVDAIVVGSLDFHGYSTIDPATLRKDEATRTESTVTGDTATEHESTGTSTTGGVIAIFPMLTVTESSRA